jgi:hypothetical protein
MSTCDASGLNIQNETKLPIIIQGILLGAGTVQDLLVGQVVEPGTTASGRAYSASGTGGRAQGAVSIQLDGTGEIANLAYFFGTPWSTGTGICSAQAGSVKFHSGDKKYEAVVSTTASGPGRKAGVLWRVVEV